MSHGLFASLYEAGHPFALIDTRERRDHVDGHWFGSTNIPLSVLTQRIGSMIPDRGFPVHLLDWQDAASEAAAWSLSQQGYGHVTRCRTSHPGRCGDGFVKGEYVWSKAFGEVVAHSCGLPEVTPSDYLDVHRGSLLLDVRPTSEYRAFTIPGSRSLPNSLLLANLQALKDSGRTVLLHCAGRTRSIIGACTLKAAGYDGPFAIFRGGTQAWQLDGLEREFGAKRLFATDAGNIAVTQAFLDRWNIPFDQVADDGLARFLAAHPASLLFDVSDDAATGAMRGHGILSVSGTNLVQQTDRSIARYHVPVILLDDGSGSRAAFAAYWLQVMGFQVRVALLQDMATLAPAEDPARRGSDMACDPVTLDQLLQHRDMGRAILDFRPSKHFREVHVTGSQWRNIGEVLAAGSAATRPEEPAIIIGSDPAQANATASCLGRHGWPIAGIFAWDTADWRRVTLEPGEIGPGKQRPGGSHPGDPGTAIDESALLAGRHHGNFQDSRDYLAWEEELPGQIDPSIRRQWQRNLAR